MNLHVVIFAYGEDGKLKSLHSYAGSYGSIEDVQHSSVPAWQSFPADLPKQIFVIESATWKTIKYSDNFDKFKERNLARSAK